MGVVVDKEGYRLNVGIVLVNQYRNVFWGRRVGHDAWQFPQGGVHEQETLEEAMYRELYEEVGLQTSDVSLIACTKRWLRYRLPPQFIRHHTKPTVIGQRQKWFLLRLLCNEQQLHLDRGESPEFDSWRWVNYWYPIRHVIYFKRETYRRMLSELRPYLDSEE